MLTIYDGRGYFYQYDIGQKLTVSADEGTTVTEVHIGVKGGEHWYVFEPSDDAVTIPDELLQIGAYIVAYEYSESDGDGHTINAYAFRVARRPKPTDYSYTPTESYSWEYWANKAEEYAEAAETSATASSTSAETAKTSAETAKTSAESAETSAAESEAARDEAVEARDTILAKDYDSQISEVKNDLSALGLTVSDGCLCAVYTE